MLLFETATLEKVEKPAALGYGAIDVGLTGVIYHDDPHPHNSLLDDECYEPALDAQMAKCKELGIQIRSSHLPYRFNYTDPASENYDHCYAMTVRAPRASGDRRRDHRLSHRGAAASADQRGRGGKRTESGFVIEREGRAPVVYEGNIRDLKILRDGCLVEVFVNGGREVYTALL